MHLQARTTQRLEQRLLPQMLQSIEVLQLATADLAQLVDQQLEANEVLELEPTAEAPRLGREIADAAAAASAEWEREGIRACSDDVDGRRALLENQPAVEDPVLAAVREQIAFRELPRALADAVLALTQRLDDRGLLPSGLDAVAGETGTAIELLRLALGELQAMEPRGLGAGTGVEAMLLQAVDDPDFTAIECLLTQHLDALAKNQLPDVARQMQIDLDELDGLLQRVRALTPAPAATLRTPTDRHVVADVAAWLDVDGEVVVALCDETLPHLVLNDAYVRLARERDTERGLRDHLRQRVRDANELIRAIAHRQSTLLAVAQKVLRHQREFLQRGRSALRPLRMADIALELGMHASTISRAIAGKHVETTFGTLPLRDFCDGGSADGNAAAGHARSAVAQHVADLIANEDRSAPLSDDALVVLLGERGIRLARRTVTKLRQAMEIPSSYRRRRHGGEKSDD